MQHKRQSLPLSAIARDYVCNACGAPLVVRPDGETGRPRVYCIDDPIHFGWIRKSAVERWVREQGVRNWNILNDPVLIATIPGWPKPERPSVEQCYAELFGREN